MLYIYIYVYCILSIINVELLLYIYKHLSILVINILCIIYYCTTVHTNIAYLYMSLIHYLGETYYVPEHVIKNYAHIYCDDDFGYKTAYYYTRGKKKKIVTKEQQKADYTVSKLAKYEDDTFYKLTNESKHSKVFDFTLKTKKPSHMT